MNKELFVVLSVVGIAIMSSFLTVQILFASSEERADNEEQSPDSDSEQSTGGKEQETEPEPEAEDTSTLNGDGQNEGLEQRTLDIINANGLILANDTAAASGNGNGNEGTTAKEMTCVTNSAGAVFCYEKLDPDENCLKPINVEDPPLCLPKGA